MAKATDPRVASVLAELKALGSEKNRAGMARFGINTERAFGVSMAAMRSLARPFRRDHALAADFWATGYHEARIFAALIDDPGKVTPKQMDAWAADFNSWDVCDQVCMRLFAKTSFVAEKVAKWAADKREFVRRAAFATIAGYTVRQIGKHSPALHRPALKLALKLAASDDRTARWIGKDAVKELRNEKQLARLGLKPSDIRVPG